jgi:hypothetical protein
MNLDESQKSKVKAWIAEGLKLSDIQRRLSSELGLTLTYMEVRLLADDLKLTPKDIEPPKAPELPKPDPAVPGVAQGGPEGASALSPSASPAAGGVSVKVDEIARPGTVVSGAVTFSDGKIAEWYLDQTGRLGLMPQQQGYRPSQPDVLAFQSQLQTELARMGF